MNPAILYQQNAITTKNKSQVVVMLYEGAIRFLKQANVSIQAKEYFKKTDSLGRARDIIFELNASLNMEDGGDISKKLRSLYTFIWTKLNEVNIKNDTVLLDKLIRILETMADAWKKISA